MLQTNLKHPSFCVRLFVISISMVLILTIFVCTDGRAQQLPVTSQGVTATQGGDATQNVQKSEIALGNPEIYKKSLAALMVLFVLAILIENALAVIFNWRVFLTLFNLRGVKTLIMVAVSWAAVAVFDIDVVSALLAAYGSKPPDDQMLSGFLTALILAGGSSGVNNIMMALGFRDRSRAVQETPKPPPTQAWLAIEVERRNAVGNIAVHIDKVTPAPASLPAAIAGSINAERSSWKNLFFRNRNRFPQSGGYVVDPNVPYDIAVSGKDAGNKPIPSNIDGQYVFAPGAIVDFKVTL